MSKQQLQDDISSARQEEVEETPTEAQKQAAEDAWEESLNSPESVSFLQDAIAKGLKELDGEK